MKNDLVKEIKKIREKARKEENHQLVDTCTRAMDGNFLCLFEMEAYVENQKKK